MNHLYNIKRLHTKLPKLNESIKTFKKVKYMSRKLKERNTCIYLEYKLVRSLKYIHWLYE